MCVCACVCVCVCVCVCTCVRGGVGDCARANIFELRFLADWKPANSSCLQPRGFQDWRCRFSVDTRGVASLSGSLSWRSLNEEDEVKRTTVGCCGGRVHLLRMTSLGIPFDTFRIPFFFQSLLIHLDNNDQKIWVPHFFLSFYSSQQWQAVI